MAPPAGLFTVVFATAGLAVWPGGLTSVRTAPWMLAGTLYSTWIQLRSASMPPVSSEGFWLRKSQVTVWPTLAGSTSSLVVIGMVVAIGSSPGGVHWYGTPVVPSAAVTRTTTLPEATGSVSLLSAVATLPRLPTMAAVAVRVQA